MLAAKPQLRKDAKKYCGRLVRKAFVPEGAPAKRRHYFTGSVIECPIFDGEVCYTIRYEDGDTEDIAWEELVEIMLASPDEAPPLQQRPQTAGLTDTTNRLTSMKHPNPRGKEGLDEGPAAKKLKQCTPSAAPTATERPAKMQGAHQAPSFGLTTPALHTEADVVGMAQQQTRHQGRARKRRASGDDDAAEDRPDADAAQPVAQTQLQIPVQPEAQPAAGFVARTVGSAGHIARIHLENFMCHHHFEIDMGTHVTLISGVNGSGKSAVMQALQICLGVTARSTGRGTNLASFIHNSANEAKVQVTMWNTGDDAFMPDVFGNRITVERQIKRVGASPYALLDWRGRKVQLERGDKAKDLLDRILDHFCVDASNPLTIITQDKARQFLAVTTDDARNKYVMFMEGTLQDKTQEELKVSNANCAIIARTLESSAAELNAERQLNAQYRSKLDKLKSADKWIEQRDLLERAAAWRAVQQMEERLEKAADAAELHVPEMVELCDRHLEAIERSKQDLLQRKQQLGEEMQRHQEIINNHGEHIRSLVRAEKEARTNKERAGRNKTAAQRALDLLNRDKKSLDDQLAQETSGKAAEARRLMEEHQQLVTAKQAAVQEAAVAANTAQQAYETARGDFDLLMTAEQQARSNVLTSQKQVSDHKMHLQRIAASQGDRLAVFQAVELNRLIEHNLMRFRQRPIGPLGAFISVTDSEWLVSAEVALGACFRDYLACCQQDAALLRQLMLQAKYGRATVSYAPFDKPLYIIPSSRRPVNSFTPLLDVLLVQDPDAHAPIMNYLTDKFIVEGIVLVEGSGQGRNFMFRAEAGPHINVAIDKDGNWYRRNGALQWVDRNHRVRREHCRMIADMSQYVAGLERDLEKHEAELGAYREELQEATSAVQQARQTVDQRDRERKAAQQAKIRAATELNRVMQAAPAMPDMAEDEHASAVMSQLSDLSKELAETQMSLQTAETALEIAEQAWSQALQQAKAEEARFAEQVREGDRLRQVMGEVEQKLAESVNMRNTAVALREQTVAGLEKLRTAVQTARAKLQEALGGATQVCSRGEGEQALLDVQPLLREEMARLFSAQRQRKELADLDEEGRRRAERNTLKSMGEYQGLLKLLERINNNIAKAEKEAGLDMRELEIRLADSNRTLDRKMVTYRRIENMVRLFHANYERQVQYFMKNRARLEHITMLKFDRYLRRRDHSGKLVFDHTERTLKLLIKPRGKNNPNAQAVEDLKQLSGGERSYTTVAFLLAIGSSTESPFRCMDEFDVFMDAINRRVATETLLEFAYENSAFQYIFLTPQNIQTVEDARQEMMKKRKIQLSPAFLKTIQMPAPRENATRA